MRDELNFPSNLLVINMKKKTCVILLFMCLGVFSSVDVRNQNISILHKFLSSQSALAADSRTGVLCTINGTAWVYTKASGVVSKNRHTGVRSAQFTFKKKLDKGSEAIQLEYNLDENKITGVLLDLKRPGKENNIISATYTLYEDTLTQHPETRMSGSLTLNEENQLGTGTAEFVVANQYEKSRLKNQADIVLHISDLNFEAIPYSDITKSLGNLLTNQDQK